MALYGGEQDEKRRLIAEFDRVLRVMRRIVSASTQLTCVTAGYGWFTIIAPIVVASPGYFGGDLSFGGLMMVVGAFIRVQQALRWFIDNFSTIADWRATLLRIASFRETVITMNRLGATENPIEFVKSIGETIGFEKLEIATPKANTTLSERHVEIAPGERCSSLATPVAARPCCFGRLRACGLGAQEKSRYLRPTSTGPRQRITSLSAFCI
jgi:putative ATP-binding cassette transporter